MVIIRDMVFKNHKYFHMFMKSPEKISTNILADRLQKLETLELILKTKDPNDGRKTQYKLTQKGLELIPLLLELVNLGANLGAKDFPILMINEIRFNRNLLLSKLKQQHMPMNFDKKSTKRKQAAFSPQTLSLFD